jgi:hypothetical protein
MRRPSSRRLAWDLLTKQPGGTPSSSRRIFDPAPQTEPAPAFEPPWRGGYFGDWLGPDLYRPTWYGSPSAKPRLTPSPEPLGFVSYENASNAKGERYVWLDPKVVEHLRSLRGPGESYSDVILTLAKGEET